MDEPLYVELWRSYPAPKQSFPLIGLRLRNVPDSFPWLGVTAGHFNPRIYHVGWEDRAEHGSPAGFPGSTSVDITPENRCGQEPSAYQGILSHLDKYNVVIYCGHNAPGWAKIEKISSDQLRLVYTTLPKLSERPPDHGPEPPLAGAAPVGPPGNAQPLPGSTGRAPEAAVPGVGTTNLGLNWLNTKKETHDWAFGAIAELVQNAGDAKATKIKIDVQEKTVYKQGKREQMLELAIEDNGVGMTFEGMKRCFSVGSSANDQEDSSRSGQYGLGFKQGSVRLGHTAVVFSTVTEQDTVSIGILSNLPYEERREEPVCLYFTEFGPESEHRHRESGGGTARNADEIFEAVARTTGIEARVTRARWYSWYGGKVTHKKSASLVMIYGIEKRNSEYRDQQMRVVAEENDLRLVMDDGSPFLRDETIQAFNHLDHTQVSHDSSLREYLRFMYRRSPAQVKLLGCGVEQGDLPAVCTREVALREADAAAAAPAMRGMMGFSEWHRRRQLCGVMFYCANCLIKWYQIESYRSSLRTNDPQCHGLLMLIELPKNMVKSNKQGFLSSCGYESLRYKASDALYKYSRRHEIAENNRLLSLGPSHGIETVDWMMCDHGHCGKWRILPTEYHARYKDKKWHCGMDGSPVLTEMRKLGLSRPCDVPEPPEASEVKDVGGGSPRARPTAAPPAGGHRNRREEGSSREKKRKREEGAEGKDRRERERGSQMRAEAAAPPASTRRRVVSDDDDEAPLVRAARTREGRDEDADDDDDDDEAPLVPAGPGGSRTVPAAAKADAQPSDSEGESMEEEDDYEEDTEKDESEEAEEGELPTPEKVLGNKRGRELVGGDTFKALKKKKKAVCRRGNGHRGREAAQERSGEAETSSSRRAVQGVDGGHGDARPPRGHVSSGLPQPSSTLLKEMDGWRSERDRPGMPAQHAPPREEASRAGASNRADPGARVGVGSYQDRAGTHQSGIPAYHAYPTAPVRYDELDPPPLAPPPSPFAPPPSPALVALSRDGGWGPAGQALQHTGRVEYSQRHSPTVSLGRQAQGQEQLGARNPNAPLDAPRRGSGGAGRPPPPGFEYGSHHD